MPRPGTSWSGVLVGGKDGSPSLGTWPCTALGLQLFPGGEGVAGSTSGTEKREFLPQGVFQDWSVDQMLGQGVPGWTIESRKGNSCHPRETIPGLLECSGPVHMIPLPH